MAQRLRLLGMCLVFVTSVVTAVSTNERCLWGEVRSLALKGLPVPVIPVKANDVIFVPDWMVNL